MSYAALQDMVDRFGELELVQRTDRTDGATIDAVVLGRALADADAEIVSALGTSPRTIARLRKRFVTEGLQTLDLGCADVRMLIEGDGATTGVERLRRNMPCGVVRR